MPLARCELVQLENGNLKFSETVDERIDEWPHSWPLGELSYRLDTFSPDLEERHQIRAVTMGWRAWQLRLKNLHFRRERNPDAHVDVNVAFEPLSHFDDKKGVLAHAVYPGQGERSGDCHLNENWDWVSGVQLSTMGKPPMVPILIHEFGHILGLTHDNFDKTDIMYPSFNLGQKKNTIGSRSIARAQSRYGKRNLAAWKIAYFLRRRDRGTDFR